MNDPKLTRVYERGIDKVSLTLSCRDERTDKDDPHYWRIERLLSTFVRTSQRTQRYIIGLHDHEGHLDVVYFSDPSNEMVEEVEKAWHEENECSLSHFAVEELRPNEFKLYQVEVPNAFDNSDFDHNYLGGENVMIDAMESWISRGWELDNPPGDL